MTRFNLSFRFQGLAHQALRENEVRLPQLGRFSGVCFFQGLRHALTAFNALAYRNIDPRSLKTSSDAREKSQRHGNLRRLAFDFHPINYRLKLTAWMAWLVERPLDRWPHLFRITVIPSQIPRHWKHPWEFVEENGKTIYGYRRDPEKQRTTRKVGPDIFQSFFAIAEKLDLTDRESAQLLGGVSERTIQRWRMHPIMFVQHEHLRRMEQTVRIWSGLMGLVNDAKMAKKWLRSPNHSQVFQGQDPLGLLLDPNKKNGFEILSSFFCDARC
ncbi:MAG: hypothetical protein IPN59_12940 [Holophaga sp.]|nr:hypothetical protein [Holophaga sp.]